MVKHDVIFWDWNGTLLNDTEACVDAMNSMLLKRNRPKIDVDYYRSVFGFPVKDYYVNLGFDFSEESFEELSVEFISDYSKNLSSACLQPFSKELLMHFKELGKTQVVISAMEHTMLLKQLEQFGLTPYFDAVNGINDIYATSKTYLAKNYIADTNSSPKNILFIGDTLHDMEVAHEVGTDVVLVSNGHHPFSRLCVNGNKVIENLGDLLPKEY